METWGCPFNAFSFLCRRKDQNQNWKQQQQQNLPYFTPSKVSVFLCELSNNKFSTLLCTLKCFNENSNASANHLNGKSSTKTRLCPSKVSPLTGSHGQQWILFPPSLRFPHSHLKISFIGFFSQVSMNSGGCAHLLRISQIWRSGHAIYFCLKGEERQKV